MALNLASSSTHQWLAYRSEAAAALCCHHQVVSETLVEDTPDDSAFVVRFVPTNASLAGDTSGRCGVTRGDRTSSACRNMPSKRAAPASEVPEGACGVDA